MNPFTGILLCLLLMAAWPVVFWAVNRVYPVKPELSRKGVHILSGLTCLLFPYIFTDSWPVFVLAVLSLALLTWMRSRKDSIGQVLHGVGRLSYGEICFPVAVALVFQGAHGDVILYFIPVLIMTLADAAGALVGLRYGQARFTTEEGFKSAEGSLAFFLVAFLSTHIPLLLLTDASRADSLLIGLLMGGLIMMVEAISWRGLDNLFIPLIAFVLLVEYTELETADLVFRLLLLVVILIGILVWKRKTYLNSSATLLVALILYLTCAVGGWRWFISPVMLALGYALLCPHLEKRKIHDMRGIAAVSVGAMFWFFIAYIWRVAGFYFPFVLAIAAQLGMIAFTYFLWQMPERGKHFAFWSGVIMASAFVGAPLLFVGLEFFTSMVYLLILMLSVGLTIIMFNHYIVEAGNLHQKSGRWIRQGIIGFAISTIGLIPTLVYYSQWN